MSVHVKFTDLNIMLKMRLSISKLELHEYMRFDFLIMLIIF